MNAAAAATAGSHRSSQVDEAYRSRRASDDPNADRLSRALRRGSSVEAPLSPGLRLRTSQGDAYAGVVPGLNLGASRVASAPAAADFRPSLAFAGGAVRTSFAGGTLLHDDARPVAGFVRAGAPPPTAAAAFGGVRDAPPLAVARIGCAADGGASC